MLEFFRRQVGTVLRARGWKLFNPILLGATLRARLLACAGVAAGIGVTGLMCGLAAGRGLDPLLVAPMGASAVLVFAVPASPLAQPWPTIGGNIISAAVGVIVAYFVPQPVIAAALAAALAIAAMSFTRSLHPPGGAAALVAVFSGAPLSAADALFPIFPVGLNACLLVACGWAFHRLAGNSYPHLMANPQLAEPGAREIPPGRRVGFKPEDIDAALDRLGESFDISRADLDLLLREVETQALLRDHGTLRCADLMSRNVVSIDHNAIPTAARAKLLAHDVRDLPVIDEARRVVGAVGFRQLATPASRVADMMMKPVTANAQMPALELIRLFTDGHTHTVIIVDDQQHLLGVVTQTDLLAAMAMGLSQEIQGRQGGLSAFAPILTRNYFLEQKPVSGTLTPGLSFRADGLNEGVSFRVDRISSQRPSRS